MKILKWFTLSVLSIIIVGFLFLRFTRFSDKIIYQQSGTKYTTFTSKFNHEEYFLTPEKKVKLHVVLFRPDSIEPIGTIFHCMGKGITSITAQNSYKPLLDKGFQIVNFERRDFGLSTGVAIHSPTLKKDALLVFDELYKNGPMKNKPIIIWGRSLGSAFATMIAAERQKQIAGLIIEGGFSSFPNIGKFYARALNLQNFKWLVPVIMNNDFPANKNIQSITKPIILIHSSEDAEVPFYLGKQLYDAANKENTEFWEIKGKHIRGINIHEKAYVDKFLQMLKSK